jgi:hypothetical protein
MRTSVRVRKVTSLQRSTHKINARRSGRPVNRFRRCVLAGLVVGGLLAAASPALANVKPPIRAPRPVLKISSTRKDFGFLFVGATFNPAVFTVRNATSSILPTAFSGPLSVSLQELAGSPNSFGVVQDTCTGTSLGPSQSCSVSVVFQPQGKGLAIGELAVTPPGNCCPPGPIALLSGTGRSLTD